MTETNTDEGIWRCICRKFSKKETVRETLEDLIEEAGSDETDSNLSAQEQELLNNILYLKDKRCGQIMVPRADIIAFPKDGTAEDLCQLMVEKGHSRIPVYGESLDDIVGMVHIIDVAKALLKGNRRIKVGSLDLRLIKFVSPSMHVLDLLNEMQKNKMHIALVVDEYGGIDGLVTIEDLLEEIVGDIEDEYDVGDEPEIFIQGNHVIIAAGHAELDDIYEKTGVQLSDNLEDGENEIDTIGGLICAIIERVPQRGEVIAAKNGINFRILDVDSRRIKRVMIVLPQEAEIAENRSENN